MKCPIYKKKVTEKECKKCLFYKKGKCGLEYWIRWNRKGKIDDDKPKYNF